MTSLKARSATVLVRAAVPAALLAAVSACATLTARPVARPARTASHAAPSPGRWSHAGPAPGHTGQIPRYAHIVVVIEENHAYSQIIGSSSAPYINSLAGHGALFTRAHAVGHPSEPNYMALFAGSAFGISGDPCPVSESGASLASELIGAGHTYASYSESMPSRGYQGCSSGEYARKHNPAANFTSLPPTANDTFAQFPGNYASLPTVSFVAPNLLNDMHDGTVSQGDAWLKSHFSRYVTWATANNSLLIVTWDEDDGSAGNQVATIFAGAHIKAGRYSQNISHYNVLRTIEQAYALAPLRSSATATPITDIFS